MCSLVLTSSAPLSLCADQAYLQAYRFADGGGFPPSYVDLATQLGWGRLGGLFLVYVPRGGHSDSWLVQSPLLRSQLDVHYDAFDHEAWLLEPDGYIGLERVLVPFARSENGECLAWDSAHRTADQEMPIYVVTARWGGIRYGGANLAEFLYRCTHAEDVQAVLGPGYAALPATFEPLPVTP